MDKLLKPCPFCGNKNVEIVKYYKDGVNRFSNKYAVQCPYTGHDEGCGGEGQMNKIKELSIKAWNTRTSELAPTMSVQQLKTTIEYLMIRYNLGSEETRDGFVRIFVKAISGKVPRQPTYSEEEIICCIWREFRGEETEPYHWGDCNQQPQPCLLCHCERIAKFLSGKLPKQPTYSEEEIYNISCRCDTRNDFVKALFGKLRQPRKVDGKKIKQLIDDCVSVGNRTELFLSIMKEIGDE